MSSRARASCPTEARESAVPCAVCGGVRVRAYAPTHALGGGGGGDCGECGACDVRVCVAWRACESAAGHEPRAPSRALHSAPVLSGAGWRTTNRERRAKCVPHPVAPRRTREREREREGERGSERSEEGEEVSKEVDTPRHVKGGARGGEQGRWAADTGLPADGAGVTDGG